MARRKPIKRYSSEYMKLFEVATKKEVVIPCESKQQAENLRNELYTCRSVIYDEGDEALALAAQNVRFFIKLQPSGYFHLIAEPIRQPKTGETENGN